MRKILRNERGFTLIELLVVIAIIGILMGVVIVGINPTARINEATQAKAQANVQQIASAMESCITNSIATGGAGEADCNSWDKLYNGDYVKAASAPSGVTIAAGCVSAAEASSQFCKYTTATGVTACDQATGC